MTTFLNDAHNPPSASEKSLPNVPSLDDLLDEGTWLEWRSTALPPQIVSDLVTSEQGRAEFVEGARLLRLDRAGRHVLPHQLLVADMLGAGVEENGLLVPRRSAKTTSVLAVILGRCTLREDHQAAMTLTTTAAKTSERMRADVFAPIERSFPDEKSRPVKVLRGKGDEHLEWRNGSRFAAVSPNGDAFRSSAYDTVLVDESGEASPGQGEDISGAILPTFDTRPGAQVVYAGTAGDYREGLLLWDALQVVSNGRLVYAFPDEATEDELAAWEPTEEHPFGRVRDLVTLTHPGVASGLTTLDKVRTRFDRLGPVRFGREYGGVFGRAGVGAGVIDPGKMIAAGRAGHPEVPERFALVAMPSYTQRKSSLVAAWRDAEGRACGYVLDHRPGTTWLAEAAAKKARDHRAPVIYDAASGPMRVEVETMKRMTPRPRLVPQTTVNVTAAAALLTKEINAGNAAHWNQPPLTEAAEIARRRSVGASAWAFGRPAGDSDISALEAWAMGLRWYDENLSRSRAGAFLGEAA